MWTSIASAVSGLLSLLNGLLSWAKTSRIRRDGQNELRLKQTKEELDDLRKAAEIDSRPTPSDKSDILSRL